MKTEPKFDHTHMDVSKYRQMLKSVPSNLPIFLNKRVQRRYYQ